ncbi:MAG: DUF533 domain-containing protein [Bacteroidota bacterium]
MSMLTDDERDAVATICLMAAVADGHKDARERDRLRSIYASLYADFEPERYERVLLGQVAPEAEAARLGSAGARMLAYEMAVAVCDADGRADAAEQAFLDRLGAALGLDGATTAQVDADAGALASGAVEVGTTDAAPLVPATLASAEAVPEAVAPSEPPAAVAEPPEAEVDALVLRYAVTCAALELLPQTVATVAVVPLQTKMVYRIGLRHGHRLDATQAKELLATVGLGLTSQVVETYARDLVGGLLGGVAKKALGKKKGKKARKAARAAAGAAYAFAATYALGRVAEAYYAGGRRLDAGALRAQFDRHAEAGRALYETHRPAAEARAQATDLPAILAQLRA